MANIFATGHGLIGSYLAKQEQEDKFKRQQQALADFMSGGVSAQPVQPVQQPAQRPIMAPVDPQVESMPAYQRNAVVDSYTDAGKKAGFLEYKPSQQEQPAQQSLQQPPGSDWINQSVAGLVKKVKFHLKVLCLLFWLGATPCARAGEYKIGALP